MSQYDDWLNSLEAAGLRDDLPPLSFGTAYSVVWALPEHPVLGDFTGGSFKLEVKDAPGTGGTVLAEATVASGTFADSINPVTIDLAVADQSGITEPSAPAVTNLYFTVLYTPGGGAPVLARGGLWPVQAGVTSA